MLTSLALIFIVGLSMAAICQKIRLPRIIGLLATGIVLGPFVLNLLDPKILSISAELRKMALVIILIKAGLSLNLSDLKKVGRPALLMSFLPACFEIAGFAIFGPKLLNISITEALVMGSILGAVSPAVVVPMMVKLMDTKWGTEKSIPQMILAGASLDDVFVIVLFQTFVNMEAGGTARVMDFVNIPVSIISGIALGLGTGLLFAWLFEIFYKKENKIRNSTKMILILGIAFILMAAEEILKPWVALSGLLAVMSMACAFSRKSDESVGKRLSQKFGKLWIAAEAILFVMVGAAVDIRYSVQAGPLVIAMIFIALAFRSAGVLLCMIKTPLNWKERIFCVIAYLPKATVQAAIGSIPLTMGLSCGNMALSLAVTAIVITAPLGAFGMELTYKKLLVQEKNESEKFSGNPLQL